MTARTDSIIAAINRLTDAVKAQTEVLCAIGANIDDSLDIEREKLEHLRKMDGETPTEHDDGDDDVWTPTEHSKAAMTALLKAHLDSIP